MQNLLELCQQSKSVQKLILVLGAGAASDDCASDAER